MGDSPFRLFSECVKKCSKYSLNFSMLELLHQPTPVKTAVTAVQNISYKLNLFSGVSPKYADLDELNWIEQNSCFKTSICSVKLQSL